MADEQRVSTPLGMLALQSWGNGNLPPLLAIHGWLDNAASFALLAPRLASRFHVIALDLPGHGHSDHLPAGVVYHFTDYMHAVLAVIAALGLERCNLLGHSLGAGVAALVAAAAPSHIERLLLIEGLGPLADDGTHTLQRLRDSLAASAQPPRPLRIFADIVQAVGARTLASGLRRELARPIVARGLQPAGDGWCWRSDTRLTRPSAVRMAETQVRAILRGIAAPTTLLLAEPATSYLPGALMEARAACVPTITTSRLRGGHHLHLEHPQAVADWITTATAQPVT